jgi:hypothetical protein
MWNTQLLAAWISCILLEHVMERPRVLRSLGTIHLDGGLLLGRPCLFDIFLCLDRVVNL